ncbi:unnamed protein product [Laminaria digitata]
MGVKRNRPLKETVSMLVLHHPGRTYWYLFTKRNPVLAAPPVLAMSAWSVKTGRAPSRHGRDARVYGLTTTAMHDTDGENASRRARKLAPKRHPIGGHR